MYVCATHCPLYLRKKFGVTVFLHYLCANKQRNFAIRQVTIHRGMEQLVARRAHNPKVVWFESHSRYLEAEQTFCFFFFDAGTRTTVRTDAKPSAEPSSLGLCRGAKEEKQITYNLISPTPATLKQNKRSASFFLMPGREPRFEPTPNRAQSQVCLGYAEVRRSRRID